MPRQPELLERHVDTLETFFTAEISERAYDFLTPGLEYQFATGGKRLRPALCLLSCDALGGDSRAALPFAMACEMLHNFFLIHDDIEDGDTMRRDQKTLWAEFGVPNALNVSDFVISRAYRLILDHPPARSEVPPLALDVRLALGQAYSFAFQKTVEGQALDINLRGDDAVRLEHYYRLVTLKTGYYLALPWVGGALVAGMQADSMDGLWELGKCLGPAFQIRDDLIDLTEGKGRGGEIGCDLREGKPSIFYARVLEEGLGSADDRQRLLDTIRAERDETTEEDVRWAIDFFAREGVLSFADEEAKRLARRSEQVLEELPMDPSGKDSFREVIQFIIERKF